MLALIRAHHRPRASFDRDRASSRSGSCGGPLAIQSRVTAAVAVLNELGGLAELEELDGGFVIRGYSCPLGALMPDHPEVCGMAETLFAGIAGVPIREHCDRRVKPRCWFEVALSESTATQA